LTAASFDRGTPVFDQRASLDAYDEMSVEESAEDEEFWGPRGVDPGGDPVRGGEDDQGAFVILAGRRVPILVDGAMIRIGVADRIGLCGAMAQGAVDRLFRVDPLTAQGITMCFGRAFGTSGQTWVEFYDEGRWQVYDLTISDYPFPRAAYLAAIHGRVGTRLPMLSRATIAAFYQAVADGAWWGRRVETLSPQALAARQQKE
jgi:hypothetical protein